MDSWQMREISLEELMPLFREQLERGQTVRFSPRGTSMLPLLRQGRDDVELSAPPAKLKKYDVPLYQRSNGQYVLHRIVGVTGDSYICMGDNQFQKEPGVGREQVIGVMTACYREGKRRPVTDLRYWLYCRVWYHTCPLRQLWRRGVGLLRRLIK